MLCLQQLLMMLAFLLMGCVLYIMCELRSSDAITCLQWLMMDTCICIMYYSDVCLDHSYINSMGAMVEIGSIGSWKAYCMH